MSLDPARMRRLKEEGCTWATGDVHHALNRGKTGAAERLLEQVRKGGMADSAELLFAEGRLRMHQGRYTDGARALESCLKRQPGNRQARRYLFACYRDGGDYDHMLDLAREFRDESGDDEKVLAYLAFEQVCDWGASAALEDDVIRLVMNGRVNPAFIPTLFLGFLTKPNLSAEHISRIHRAWGARVEAAHRPLSSILPAPVNGRLRIGYLSADFYYHSVGKFIEPVIAGHDRSRFEIFCYAHLHKSDHYTEDFRRQADHFIEVTDMSARELAERIRADGIHVLVELGGYTGFSRLESLAFKPAPVQLSWLGYPATTGMQAVDFRIGDADVEPEHAAALYSEKLLLLPETFLCMSRLPQVPRQLRAPAEDNGFVTFATLNDVRKLNLECIETWSEILRRVPNARLMVKGRGSDASIVQENLRRAFAACGIAPQRLDFRPFAPTTGQQMQDCLDADIALDTFPYNGTTTTFETLWLGIPVVTLIGDSHVSRTSYAIMKHIGFETTSAASRKDYVEKAVALAANPANLSLLRKTLPTLVRHSPLCRVEPFVHHLENTLLEACTRKGLIQNVPGPGVSTSVQATLADGVTVVFPEIARDVAASINALGDWYEPEIRFLRRVCRPGMRVVETQAGPGLYALSLARIVGDSGAVLAVENDSDMRGAMEASCRKNGLNRVDVADGNGVDLQDFASHGCDILIAEDLSPVVKTLTDLPSCIMTRSKDGADGLIHEMEDRGFHAYRYVPGLMLLAPVHDGMCTLADHGRLFFCGNECAGTLVEEGLLVREEAASIQLPDMPEGWMLPFEGEAFSVSLLPIWRRRIKAGILPEDWPRLASALLAFQLSRETTRPAAERYGLMLGALSLLRDSVGIEEHPVRLCTFARIALELGLQDAARDAIHLLIELIQVKTTFIPDEPFLPLSPYYDAGLHEGRMANWVLAQALTMADFLSRPAVVTSSGVLRDRLVELGMPATMIARVLIERPGTAQHGRDTSVAPVADDNGHVEFDPAAWSDRTRYFLERWEQTPDDKEIIWRIRELQSELSDACMRLSGPSDVGSLLERGAATGVRALLKSPVRYEILDGPESASLRALRERLREARGEAFARLLVPAMACFLPHEIPMCRDVAALPASIMKIFLDFIWQPVSPFRSRGEAEAYSQHMRTWMDWLHQNIVRRTEEQATPNRTWHEIATHFLHHANFLAVYQGEGSLKKMMVQRAEVMAAAMRGLPGLSLEYRIPDRPVRRERIRIGVLATHYSPQTETYAMLAHYAFLDRDRFEVILFALSATGHPLEVYCREHADDFVLLEGAVSRMVRRIRQYNLDILLFGSNVSTVSRPVTMLALHRLARIQVANHIQPTTTGMPNMDFFLSGTWTETDASSHYTESPELIDGPGFCFHFPDATKSPCRDQQGMKRALGIPDNALVLISGANCMKWSPELLHTWAQILLAAPKTVLALYPFNPNWSASYNSRAYHQLIHGIFNEAGVESSRLFIFKALQDRNDIFNYLHAGDIYLDSFPLVGATSLIDPLLAGLPVVTMSGTCLRFREADSMLRSLGLEQFVARDEQEYVSMAVALAHDETLRLETRSRIQKAMNEKPLFLDAHRFSVHVGEAYERMMVRGGWLLTEENMEDARKGAAA